MARNWHYLRTSADVGWPKAQAVLALSLRVETPGDPSAIRLGVALDSWGIVAWRDKGAGPYREIVQGGKDAPSLWRMLSVLMRRGERLWLWCEGVCHALSVIGGWNVIRPIPGAVCIVSDPPCIVDAVCAGLTGTLRLLDSRNLGILHDDTCASGIQSALALSARIRGYQLLVREMALGGLRMTAAAQAWHGWKHRFLQCPVEVHNDTGRLNAEKAACFGGRCEVNRVGTVQGPVYEIDAQAHYPACATDYPLPARTVRPSDVRGLTAEQAAAKGMLVIARGRVYTETPCVPCHHGGLVVYPVGSWPATYCWPEVELVRREGGWFDVKEWWGYEPADCLSGYMLAMWRMRMHDSGSGESHRLHGAKLLANSLVGRIGALGRTWVNVPDGFAPDQWCQWWERHPEDGQVTRWRSIAGRVECETIRGWGDESIPAIASWVYSLGRVRLHQWMRIAGFDEVFYCDTDSLWTTARGLHRIEVVGALRPGVMGGLRVKGTHAWARFYGTKHYDSPAGVKWAGIPRESVSALDGGWTYTYSESPGQAARAGRAPVAELIRVDVPDARSYRGGAVGADGRTYPLEVYIYEQV